MNNRVILNSFLIAAALLLSTTANVEAQLGSLTYTPDKTLYEQNKGPNIAFNYPTGGRLRIVVFRKRALQRMALPLVAWHFERVILPLTREEKFEILLTV